MANASYFNSTGNCLSGGTSETPQGVANFNNFRAEQTAGSSFEPRVTSASSPTEGSSSGLGTAPTSYQSTPTFHPDAASFLFNRAPATAEDFSSYAGLPHAVPGVPELYPYSYSQTMHWPHSFWPNINRGYGYLPAGKKPGRQTYYKWQTDTLERQFMETPYLNRQKRIQLSRDTHLSERQVKIWFQNRRMKKKKENQGNRDAKKESDESSNSNVASATAGLGQNNLKQEVKPELNPLPSQAHTTSLVADAKLLAVKNESDWPLQYAHAHPMRQILKPESNPQQAYCYPMHVQEGYTKSLPKPYGYPYPDFSLYHQIPNA